MFMSFIYFIPSTIIVETLRQASQTLITIKYMDKKNKPGFSKKPGLLVLAVQHTIYSKQIVEEKLTGLP